MQPGPHKKSKIIIDILRRNNIAAIINICSGGLVKIEGLESPHIHFVSTIPYDWVFPKVYAVIHHGGSGTTHMALKSGCASLIIPHIADQFFWNNTLYKMGVGPLGTQIGRFTTKNIEAKVVDLLKTISYKNTALKISVLMNSEDFDESLYQSLIESPNNNNDSPLLYCKPGD
ncbi:hypothetical protein MNBD_GAMMA12-2587 [hydrothermal vent metagenome]|uniref:Erythromycin biosynthesis protein CIII-like C-terminal domain-containing protein n=1 Tax=hydrothermal vent metagenome TaxID=652676 RepID=A0A3B0Z646_9ZZZZ